MADDEIVNALRRAVELAPGDAALRLHLADVLLQKGAVEEAVAEAATVLAQDAGNADARKILAAALATPVTVGDEPKVSDELDDHEFDFELEELGPVTVSATAAPPSDEDLVEIVSPLTTLKDVGGMESVKKRLNAAFIAPLRNPELRAMYGASLRGGLLMYGPPGCGKTFLARAVAGELDASFLSVALHDILNPMLGVSEHALHTAFEEARRAAPCVLFLDEIDALGQRRSQTRNSGMHGVVVQLLEELDGMSAANDGVFVLAATNQPWDIDPALRRPGRLDRTLLVLPPDVEARRSIFELHLRDRPVAGIDYAELAQRTEGYTGADIAHICASAAEGALLDSIDSGTVRPIGMADLLGVIATIKSSASPWLDSVRNLVLFGDDDGTFDELRAYLKKGKRL